MFWNDGSNSRIDLPCQRSRAGLYSQVSTWLGPPLVKIQMTRLARARKWPGSSGHGVERRVRGGNSSCPAGPHRAVTTPGRSDRIRRRRAGAIVGE